MINGFLHADGRKIVDGRGREVLLKGWGLGNWLVQEGYMWLSGEENFDRTRRIEQMVKELAGEEYAANFWKQYRKNYIRREDILKIADLGYNSVRIPLHYRLFMTDEEEWKKEGFELLDQFLRWCEEAGIYAFLDLHAAPGGQTGTNIDDSVDNVPRLFMEEKYQKKCIRLWKKLASCYHDREVVGGYDLLNEPIAPPDAGYGDYDGLIPKLSLLYERLTEAIRQVDQNHMLSIEGAHWATDLRIFDHKYDENMVLHFHRYAEMPDFACLQKYIDKADHLNVPLWIGESGENMNEWYAALYPLSLSLGIGYNLWPWKKMECTNSPYSIRMPGDYQLLLDYYKGGERPCQEKVRQILDEYLENIKIENCVENPEVTCHVFRKPPFSLRATDFDQYAGAGRSFSGTGEENKAIFYRCGCGMYLVELKAAKKKRFVFDSQWDRFGLVLRKGEFVCYSLGIQEKMELEIILAPGYPGGVLSLGRKGETDEITVSVDPAWEKVNVSIKGGKGELIVKATDGEMCLEKLVFR